MLRQIISAAVYTLLLYAFEASVSAQGCGPDIMESKTKSLALLEAEQNDRQNPVCIQFALYGVRGTKSQQVVDVLLKYLDFRRPTTNEEGVIHRHLVTLGEMYPAIDSMYLMEDLAAPNIVSMIAANKGTELARQNALVALTEIYQGNGPKGVALLKAEARKRTDDQESVRLLNAAKDLVALCDVADKEKCAQELSKEPQ
jgi:hypothetical protein